MRSPSICYWIVGSLVLAHALTFGWSTLILDGARDLSYALAIAQGHEFPLQGPLINDSLHLGPVWFYLLAIPLLLSNSMGVALLFAGALAALKFPLAFAIGRRLDDARLGCLFAVAVGLPGWNSAAPMLANHASLTEAALLACLYALLRLGQHASGRWWLAYGLLQGLALHAHPVTLLAALPIPYVLYRRRALHADWPWIVAGLVASLLWFVPMLIAEAGNGWPALAQLSDYASRPDAMPYVERLGRLIVALWWDVPALLSGWLLPRGGLLLIAVLYGALLLSAALGMLLSLRDPLRRRGVLAATALMLLSLLLLVAFRDRTPQYMLLGWLPFQALWLALGWRSLDALDRRLASTCLTTVALLSVAANVQLVRIAEHGLADLPSARFYNALSQVSSKVNAPLLPAWRLDQLGGVICGESRPVVLHGSLALYLDIAGALPVQAQCPKRLAAVDVGGGAASNTARHLLGLTPGQLQTAGISADWSQALTMSPLRVIASDGTEPVAFGPAYPFRRSDAGERRNVTVSVRTADGERVLFGSPLAGSGGATLRAASVNGAMATPIHAGHSAAIFQTDGAADWSLDIDTVRADQLDVVVF